MKTELFLTGPFPCGWHVYQTVSSMLKNMVNFSKKIDQILNDEIRIWMATEWNCQNFKGNF